MLNELIATINKNVQTEKIFCLGTNYYCKSASNIFETNVVQAPQVESYQLLILLGESEKRQEEDAQNIIENCGRVVVPFTTIILPPTVFNRWMQQGHGLAHRVYHANCLVYDAGNSALLPPGNYNPAELCKKVELEYRDWMQRAHHFLRGALYYKDQKLPELAAFNLHQTTELALMAIVRVTTGYRAGTHNIDRLFTYAVNFCSTSLNVLPNDTPTEKKLRKLLAKAYIHSRYKDDYVLTAEELTILIDRVLQLVKACEVFKTILDENKYNRAMPETENCIARATG